MDHLSVSARAGGPERLVTGDADVKVRPLMGSATAIDSGESRGVAPAFSVERYMAAQTRVGELQQKLHDVEHARRENKKGALTCGAKFAVFGSLSIVAVATSILPTGIGQLIAVLSGAYAAWQGVWGVVAAVRWGLANRELKKVGAELKVAQDLFRQEELLRLKEMYTTGSRLGGVQIMGGTQFITPSAAAGSPVPPVGTQVPVAPPSPRGLEERAGASKVPSRAVPEVPSRGFELL